MIEHQIQILKLIRKGNISSKAIMTLFNANMKVVNELIDYLYGEGLIEEPQKRADGNRAKLKLTSSGLNFIIKNKHIN